MEYEDVCPALVALPIQRVLIGDVIWGWEVDANQQRKGWDLMPEPVTVDGRGLQEWQDRWIINKYHLFKTECRYVLIAKPEKGGKA